MFVLPSSLAKTCLTSKGVTLTTNNVTVPIQIVEVNLTEDESPLKLEMGQG